MTENSVKRWSISEGKKGNSIKTTVRKQWHAPGRHKLESPPDLSGWGVISRTLHCTDGGINRKTAWQSLLSLGADFCAVSPPNWVYAIQVWRVTPTSYWGPHRLRAEFFTRRRSVQMPPTLHTEVQEFRGMTYRTPWKHCTYNYSIGFWGGFFLWRMHTEQGLGGSQTRSFSDTPRGAPSCLHMNVSPTRKLHPASVSRVWVGVSSHRVDWLIDWWIKINGHVIESNLQPTTSPQRSGS